MFVCVVRQGIFREGLNEKKTKIREDKLNELGEEKHKFELTLTEKKCQLKCEKKKYINYTVFAIF